MTGEVHRRPERRTICNRNHIRMLLFIRSHPREDSRRHPASSILTNGIYSARPCSASISLLCFAPYSITSSFRCGCPDDFLGRLDKWTLLWYALRNWSQFNFATICKRQIILYFQISVSISSKFYRLLDRTNKFWSQYPFCSPDSDAASTPVLDTCLKVD